jgi:putative oxidoreductase
MKVLDNLAPNAHWLLRIGLASVFLYHGVGKLGNLEGMSEAMQMPVFMIAMLGIVEVGGAIFILAGAVTKEWMTRLAGLGFAGTMIGAIMLVHAQHGWNSIGNMGMEFQVTLLLTSLYFVIVGNQN